MPVGPFMEGRNDQPSRATPHRALATHDGRSLSLSLSLSPTFADPVEDPGNVIIAILDDVSIDELSIYDGYPLLDSCDTECACDSSSSYCDACTAPNPDCDYPSFVGSLPDTSFLEELADRGIIFKNAYSNPTCSPTRATAQTGQYSYRTGVGQAGGVLGPGVPTIPKVLREFAPGYQSAAIGKWHLSRDEQCGDCGPVSVAGYDYFAGTPENIHITTEGGTYCAWHKVVVSDPASVSTCPDRQTRRVYATKDNVDDAIRWICQLGSCGDGYCAAGENCDADCDSSTVPVCGSGTGCQTGEDRCNCASDCTSDPDVPSGCTTPRENWFIWLAFNAPHRPLFVPCGSPGAQNCDPSGCAHLADDRDQYNEMLRIVDCELSRLAAALDALDALDDTTWIVVGDNGTAGAELGSAGVGRWPAGHGKGSVYEGGVRVPLIISGKNVAPGQSGTRYSDALVNTTDIFATALELMGMDVDDAMVGVTHDSKSVLPILENVSVNVPDPPIRDYAYVEFFSPSCTGEWERAVRNDSYKLIQVCPAATSGSRCFVDADNCTEELYATDDVLECCDLAGDQNYATELGDMRNLMKSVLPGAEDDVLCTTREGDTCMGCCAIDPYHGLTVDWDLLSPEPERWVDYDAYNEVIGATCQSHVVLKTTNKNNTQIVEYSVGRASAPNQPLPLGAVTTAWVGPAEDVRVLVGAAPTLPLGSVSKVEILAQSASAYSSARFDLAGSLFENALVVEDNSLKGGRISGQITGTAKDITAYAIGQDAETSGELYVGGLESDSVIDLESHPQGSSLIFTEAVPAGAIVKITDNNGFVGTVTSTAWFNGRLCGANLVSGSTIPAGIDVLFGTSGEVCDENCSNCVLPCEEALSQAGPESTAIPKSRFISFVLPVDASDVEFAVRVRLDSLHHPSNPPLGTPEFSQEGEDRWLAPFGSLSCTDNLAGGNYACATLGCQPPQNPSDWDDDLNGAVVHVTGRDVIPSSRYIITTERVGERSYLCRSPALAVETTRWGDVYSSTGPADNLANVIDIGKLVDTLKNVQPLSEPRAWLKGLAPNPLSDPINVIDVGSAVDAVKGLPYPHTASDCQ